MIQCMLMFKHVMYVISSKINAQQTIVDSSCNALHELAGKNCTKKVNVNQFGRPFCYLSYLSAFLTVDAY